MLAGSGCGCGGQPGNREGAHALLCIFDSSCVSFDEFGHTVSVRLLSLEMRFLSLEMVLMTCVFARKGAAFDEFGGAFDEFGRALGTRAWR